jgi:hypothetical protein
MDETNGIYVAMVLWSDQQTVETLFARLPAHIAASVREDHEQHPAQFCGMRHDEETKQAFFVDGDARYIEIWTFKPVAIPEQAEEMEDTFVDFGIDEETAIHVYRSVTGHEVRFVQYYIDAELAKRARTSTPAVPPSATGDGSGWQLHPWAPVEIVTRGFQTVGMPGL